MAQPRKNSAKEKPADVESFFLADVSFRNDAVFMGRRDSIAAPYIFPSLGYYDRSGFFADASASFLVGSGEQRIDLFLVTAGYLSSSEKFNGGLSATAYFFNQDSYNVQSEILGDMSGFLSYDLKALEVSLIASTYFNSDSSADIFAGIVFDRIIYSSDKNFLIGPSITLQAGTQYFYQEYYSTSRLGNRKGQGKGTVGTTPSIPTSVELKEASEFNFLNVALGLPMQYYHEQFIFSFSPVLAFPQSSATITTEDTVIKEVLETVFYFSAGIGYWF